MMNEDEIQILIAVVHSMRKSQNYADITRDEQAVRDVTDALKSLGYVILPRGIVDALKKTLDALR